MVVVPKRYHSGAANFAFGQKLENRPKINFFAISTTPEMLKKTNIHFGKTVSFSFENFARRWLEHG